MWELTDVKLKRVFTSRPSRWLSGWLKLYAYSWGTFSNTGRKGGLSPFILRRCTTAGYILWAENMAIPERWPHISLAGVCKQRCLPYCSVFPETHACCRFLRLHNSIVTQTMKDNNWRGPSFEYQEGYLPHSKDHLLSEAYSWCEVCIVNLVSVLCEVSGERGKYELSSAQSE